MLWLSTVLGGMNEDGAYTLRIQQVRDRTGRAIYDPQAPPEPATEIAIEEAEVDYLDFLLDDPSAAARRPTRRRGRADDPVARHHVAHQRSW